MASPNVVGYSPYMGRFQYLRDISNLQDKLAFEWEIFAVTNPAQLIYSLSFTPFDNSELVMLNGVAQLKGASESYTLSGSSITFAPDIGLIVGDKIAVNYARAL